MMKKVLFSLLAAVPVLMMSVFAVSVDLNLLGGGLSLLDGLFLIGVGLVLIGVLFLCLAFLHPAEKEAEEGSSEESGVEEFLAALKREDAENTEQEEVPVSEETVVEETIPPTEEETEQEIPEAIKEETPEDPEEELEEEQLEEEREQEQEEVQPQEEKNYPTLTLTGINNGEFKILPLKDSVSLGRRLENDLIFSDTTISGVHCEITVEDDEVYLMDKDSTNGTFLNGTRITEKTAIHKGDILSLGQMELKIGI